MAKKPNPTATSATDAPQQAPVAAPSQPWAKNTADAGIPTQDAPVVNETPAPVTATQNPPENADAGDTALGDIAGDEAALAEAADLAAEVQEKLQALDDDERAAFAAEVTAFAKTKLDALHRGRAAREMEANIIDGTNHFGTAARRSKEA